MKLINKINLRNKVLLTLVLGLVIALLSINMLINLKFTKFQAGEINSSNLIQLKGSLLTFSSIFIVVAILIIGIFMLGIVRQIRVNLEKVNSALVKVTGGDLSIRLPLDVKGEFSGIFEALNNLVQQQNNLITRVSEDSENLLLYSEILSASTEEGNAAIETTNRLIEDISASIEEVSASSEEVTSFADESTSQANIGRENMLETVDKMRSISQEVQGAVTLIEDLNENTQEIGQIAELINNIADQTNLLALNAAIEAARAGEHGHGFTVVADEIRELAEETAKATSNVKDLIENTRDNSKKVIKSIKEVEEKTAEGQKITEETNQVFSLIEEASEETAAQIEQIAYAAQDLVKSSEDLMSASNDIEDMSEEINNSSQDLEEKAVDLKSIVDDFNIEQSQGENNGTKWNRKYEVGVEKIDTQHQGIFEKANYLLEAYKNQNGEGEIKEVLDFLVDYIDKHFRDEEEIQRKYNYPDYENHKRIHHNFEKAVQDVIDNYNETMNTSSLMKLNKMVTGWLIEHIKREDQKLAKHIKMIEDE
ncbi:bacteriohemerythrin [Orenia marismortui]|uniref:bacteriohemerythrin n=1 Tax=Orenia marismortui TaxID=46469 RepID=UPI000366BF3D|nr:bacteriohemerythrin [Orenia marismortui]